MTADRKADYPVGYKKPPLHTRFKKRNPGGRPRAARNLKTLLAEALEERITVAGEGGKRRRISKRELGIARLADRFAEGDRHAIKLLLDIVLGLERRTPSESDRAVSLRRFRPLRRRPRHRLILLRQVVTANRSIWSSISTSGQSCLYGRAPSMRGVPWALWSAEWLDCGHAVAVGCRMLAAIRAPCAVRSQGQRVRRPSA
jgi:hypothetical protein